MEARPDNISSNSAAAAVIRAASSVDGRERNAATVPLSQALGRRPPAY